MRTLRLILPVLDRKELPSGRVAVFFSKDQYIILTSMQYNDFIDVEEDPEERTPQPLTDDDVIQRTLSELKGNEPPAPVFTEDENIDEDDRDEVESIVDGLNLQVAQDDALSKVVLIGDDAGPDGSKMTRETVTQLVNVIVDPKFDKRYSKAAYRRLRGIPLARLMEHVNHIPLKIREAITRYRCDRMASGNLGQGKNYIPNSWASFVIGNPERDAELNNLMSPYVKPHKPPVDENSEIIESDMETVTFPTTMSDVEERLATILGGETFIMTDA